MIRITTFLILAILFSCQPTEKQPSSFNHISDVKVKEILEKSIKKMGGLENWRKLENLQFEKEFALFDSSGQIEQMALQQHNYTFLPDEIIKINWLTDGNNYEINFKNGIVSKYSNGNIDKTANETSIKNTVLSSTFVISVPFKLLDEGVVLSYDGTTTLEDDQKVEVIKAVYNPNLNENHSTPDIWWYYFDADDFRLVGYMVQHLDHFSYVKNLSEEEVGGFIFPAERKSWRVDENRNVLFLRAAYEYSNYKISPLH